MHTVFQQESTFVGVSMLLVGCQYRQAAVCAIRLISLGKWKVYFKRKESFKLENPTISEQNSAERQNGEEKQ